MRKTERTNEPTIFNLSDIDIEMDKAIQTAKKSLNDFYDAIKNPKNKNFALKIIFEHEKGTELIWTTNIEEIDGEYYGVVDNLPNSIKSVKLGDRIKIQLENVCDWMFSQNGRLFGGFTIRELRKRMTEIEKEHFDKEFIIKID
ncbi:DUF2314 domain-containing protein [Riemerella anatipestifer]|nr:DUF2314 domain-containing protein [Riemerella anatipestifer]